jgi:cold shock CspA family protein
MPPFIIDPGFPGLASESLTATSTKIDVSFMIGRNLKSKELIMGKSRETWNKKEREKQKQKAKKEKEERKKHRKETAKAGDLENMMAYVDENGVISSTPPDPARKKIIKVEDIVIGVPEQKPVDPEDLIRKGKVTFLNEAKGYGFIRDQQSGESLFVHVNNCSQQIQHHDNVSFEIEWGPKGASAINVKLV